MRKKQQSIRFESELWQDLETIMKSKKMGATKALHWLIHELKEENKSLKQKIYTYERSVSYALNLSQKNMVFRRDITVIKNGVKRIETEIERLKRQISAASRYMPNEFQRLKADSKQKQTSEGIHDPAKAQQYEDAGMIFCKVSRIYVDPSRCKTCGTFNCHRNENPKNPHLNEDRRGWLFREKTNWARHNMRWCKEIKRAVYLKECGDCDIAYCQFYRCRELTDEEKQAASAS